MARRTHRRTATGGTTALVVALLLGACGTSTPEDAPTTPSPASSTTDGAPTPTHDPQEGDVRTRLADALQDLDGELAQVVADESTTLTPLDTPWLTGWVVVDVLSRADHGPRAYVALADDGGAVVLAGDTAAFVDLLADAEVRVDDAATATAVVDTYLDSTRSFRQWSGRIASFDDVRLRPRLDAEAQATVDAARATLDGALAPTAAQPADDGYDVVAWVQDGDAVVRHEVHVGGDGALSDAAETVVSGLPVAISR